MDKKLFLDRVFSGGFVKIPSIADKPNWPCSSSKYCGFEPTIISK